MTAPIQKSAAKTKAAQQVVTGNRLIDGVVVYLDAAGGWTEKIQDARVAEGADDLEDAVATGKEGEKNRIVVEAYPIDVTRGPDGLRPVRIREKIRAEGPTVRMDLARPVGA
ncbi:DUF2849 domain-containing protein [Chenggangzhangella methanolivorans]|uniref:DUF2849 domain-containing protein n=1 Tax=Chenggangzhangella methanolivorans TaxID=1437009 RepID=A0A9E6RCT4_9HYPH|nr:DUF2849 domain-containing protein [Chenggangzhangella methanolivorans]QZO01470.1 DUF2849 domain-containing protein [Chenggangzhangella methanolivorans]